MLRPQAATDAGPWLEDAPDAPAVLDHVVVIRSPRLGAALASMTQNERPADQFLIRHETHSPAGGFWGIREANCAACASSSARSIRYASVPISSSIANWP